MRLSAHIFGLRYVMTPFTIIFDLCYRYTLALNVMPMLSHSYKLPGMMLCGHMSESLVGRGELSGGRPLCHTTNTSSNYRKIVAQYLNMIMIVVYVYTSRCFRRVHATSYMINTSVALQCECRSMSLSIIHTE